MRYTVYYDNLTGNHFVIDNGIVWSVNAVTTVDSRLTDRLQVDGGVLIPGCDVIDWRWQSAGPNGWGDYTRPCEARATQALTTVEPMRQRRATCKMNSRVV